MPAFIQSLIIAVAVVFSTQANANGFVTFDETTIESIFAQNDSTFIDFRLNPTETVFSDSLLSIDSTNEISLLHTISNAHNTDSTFAISLFYLDEITYCDGVGSNIAGCAAIVQPPSSPGSFAFLDSTYAANTTFGTNVIAHELAHTIGLGSHVAGNNTNLMNPTAYNLPGIPPLTTAQQADILASPYVQIDGIDRFVEVTPFVIQSVVATVPEPSSYALLLIGLIMVRLFQ